MQLRAHLRDPARETQNSFSWRPFGERLGPCLCHSLQTAFRQNSHVGQKTSGPKSFLPRPKLCLCALLRARTCLPEAIANDWAWLGKNLSGIEKLSLPRQACLCALCTGACLLETNWRKAWETFAAVTNGWQTPRMETFGKNLSTKPPTLAKKPFRAPKRFCHDRSSASALFFAPELASRRQLRTTGPGEHGLPPQHCQWWILKGVKKYNGKINKHTSGDHLANKRLTRVRQSKGTAYKQLTNSLETASDKNFSPDARKNLSGLESFSRPRLASALFVPAFASWRQTGAKRGKRLPQVQTAGLANNTPGDIWRINWARVCATADKRLAKTFRQNLHRWPKNLFGARKVFATTKALPLPELASRRQLRMVGPGERSLPPQNCQWWILKSFRASKKHITGNSTSTLLETIWRTND